MEKTANQTQDSESRPGARIEAALLLAGGLHPPPMARASGRSLLDLYLTPTRSVLGLWMDHLAGVGSPPARVLFNGKGPEPRGAEESMGGDVRFEREAAEYRGPGGSVRDACAEYGSDETVLVADAGRYFGGDLGEIIERHGERQADITVVCGADESPAGLYLIRCGALESIPPTGFMDLKEQFLNRAVGEGASVWVHRLVEAGTHPLRTRRQFLHGAAVATSQPASVVTGDGRVAVSRDAIAGFQRLRVVSPEARLGPDVVLHDAIVMPGATIGRGALLARAVVCPGAVVEDDMEVVDAVVSAAGVISDEWANSRAPGRGPQ